MAERTVYKYEIGFAEAHRPMPKGAEVVHVGAIAGKMYVWALVDPTLPHVQRQIGYFGTGNPLPDDAEYLGTALADGGAFVWHVFERGVR